MAAYQGRGYDLTGVGEAARVPGVRASASLFSLLGVNPALGRAFTSEEDAIGHNQVALLSDKLWREKFGASKDVVGTALTLDGKPYTIIGVMPADFRFAELDADVWVPMAFESWETESRGSHNYEGIARLKVGVSLAQAQAQMDAIAGRISQQYELAKGWGLTLRPMQEQLVSAARAPLLILFGAVALVLLIACANVANLLLARAVSREREFALRASLGAGRGRIIRQLLTEGLLLSVGGAALGWLAAYWVVAAVVTFGAAALPRLATVGLDCEALVFTVGSSILTGLFFGLAPAWFASQRGLSDTIKDAARGSTEGRRGHLRSVFCCRASRAGVRAAHRRGASAKKLCSHSFS